MQFFVELEFGDPRVLSRALSVLAFFSERFRGKLWRTFLGMASGCASSLLEPARVFLAHVRMESKVARIGYGFP